MNENMKKYISLAMSLLAMMAFTACTIEEGTTPGGDSAPYVNVMKYEVAAPLNPDNDVKVRIVANNQASDVYYLAEKTAESLWQIHDYCSSCKWWHKEIFFNSVHRS